MQQVSLVAQEVLEALVELVALVVLDQQEVLVQQVSLVALVVSNFCKRNYNLIDSNAQTNLFKPISLYQCCSGEPG